MNLELFIAKKIYFGRENQKQISRPIVRLATYGIAISLAVMLLAVAITVGFKKEVRNKLIGFGSHIQVTASVSNQTYETIPIRFDSLMVRQAQMSTYVSHVQQFATQPGIVKVNEDFQGIVLKGVGTDYDWTFFQQNLVEGTLPELSDTATSQQTLISRKMADLLRLSVGDKYHAYFIIQGKVRVRPLIVQGIYSTGFSDYDKIFIIGDIQHVRKLNQWEEDQCSGLEIAIHDFYQLEEAEYDLFPVFGNKYDKDNNYYMMRTIQDINPQIFGWLDLLDMNVVIILLLMMLVAGFTMVSGLLILILDRTNMIGVLKALGANDASVQKLFLYISLFIVGKGMVIGNLLGMLLCFIQKKLGVVHLDPDVYYVSVVPVEWSWINWLLLNVGVLLVSTFILRFSTFIITRISPSKTIRFE